MNLRDFARDQACTLRLEGICNRNPATTVLCHVRRFGTGGMGKKPPDLCGVHACDACHAALDGRSAPPPSWPEDRDTDILRAVLETLVRVDKSFVVRA